MPSNLNNSSERGSTSKKSIKSRRRSSEKRSASLTENENSDSNVVAGGIMQDILDEALRTIDERYIQEQTIKFVVHCAHQALTKTLSIHFYQHNSYSLKCWGSDRRPQPSSPDSWALDQVPLSKGISPEEEISSVSLIHVDTSSKGDLDLVSEPSESLIFDVRAALGEIISNLPIIDEEKSEESESVVSAFTTVVEGMQHYDKFKMKPQLSRISVDDTAFKLPKIDLPDSGNSRRYQSRMELSNSEIYSLPPIRTDANYKHKILQEDKTKKSKDKKVNTDDE